MTRNHTAVDQLVEDYLDEYVALDPSFATFVGISGHDAELPDLSPDGHAARSALRLRTLAALAEATPADATDRITVAAATERLSVAEEVYQLGADESDLNIIASPVQSVRAVFDLMATATADDWCTIATRLGRIPAAIDGYIVSLRAAASRGDDNIGSDGFFATLVAGAGGVPASLRADLDRGAAAAADAYARLRAFLAAE